MGEQLQVRASNYLIIQFCKYDMGFCIEVASRLVVQKSYLRHVNESLTRETLCDEVNKNVKLNQIDFHFTPDGE